MSDMKELGRLKRALRNPTVKRMAELTNAVGLAGSIMDKLLAAEAEIEHLQDMCKIDSIIQQNHKQVFADYDAEIERLKASPWISVDERLPESEDIHCFITGESDQWIGYYAEGCKTFDTWDRGWLKMKDVTHWMPIPPITNGTT